MRILDIYKELLTSKKLNEANLRQLYSKTQNETPKLAGRGNDLKSSVRYFGLSKDGTLNFKVNSQTRKGKYHYSFIEAPDIIKFGDVIEQGDHFTVQDLNSLLQMNGFRVHCNDESFLYFAFQYIATMNNYEIEPETRAPKRNNTLLQGAFCKHLYAVVYNIYQNQEMRKQIAQDIDNYLRMIEGMDYEDYQQLNHAKQIQQQNRAVKWKNKPTDYMNDYFARKAKSHTFLDDHDIRHSLKVEGNKFIKANPNASVDDFLRSYFQMTKKAFADDMQIPEEEVDNYFKELGFEKAREKGLERQAQKDQASYENKEVPEIEDTNEQLQGTKSNILNKDSEQPYTKQQFLRESQELQYSKEQLINRTLQLNSDQIYYAVSFLYDMGYYMEDRRSKRRFIMGCIENCYNEKSDNSWKRFAKYLMTDDKDYWYGIKKLTESDTDMLYNKYKDYLPYPITKTRYRIYPDDKTSKYTNLYSCDLQLPNRKLKIHVTSHSIEELDDKIKHILDTKLNEAEKTKDYPTPEEAEKQYEEYLTGHIGNVQKAMELIIKHCDDNEFIQEHTTELTAIAKEHDKSKYDKEEYEPYLHHFYPTNPDEENRGEEFEMACKHHILNNKHHWDYWLDHETLELPDIPEEAAEYKMFCVERVCDWLAMTAQHNEEKDYWYSQNRPFMKMPQWAFKFIDYIYSKIPDDFYLSLPFKGTRGELDESEDNAQFDDSIDRSDIYVHTNKGFTTRYPMLGSGYYLFQVNNVSDEINQPVENGNNKYYKITKQTNILIVNSINNKAKDVLPEQLIEDAREIVGAAIDFDLGTFLRILNSNIKNQMSKFMIAHNIDGIQIIEDTKMYSEPVQYETIIFNTSVLQEVHPKETVEV